MSVKRVGYQIQWLIEDKAGNPVWNNVENFADGVPMPPLPRAGDRVEFQIGATSFFAEILRSSLGYQIDGVVNITAVSKVHAREV
jgi:hypothetical protein